MSRIDNFEQELAQPGDEGEVSGRDRTDHELREQSSGSEGAQAGAFDAATAPAAQEAAQASAEPLTEFPAPPAASDAAETSLFQSFSQPEIVQPTRIPNLGHLALLGVLALVALLGVGLLVQVALHFRLFGVSTTSQAFDDIHYTLGSMAALYLLTLAGSLLVFPHFWRRSFFAGLHWSGATAWGLRSRMFGAACVCFALAMINGILLPGPPDTPIDKIFRTPGAAWLLFAFGVTFAPFFEEIVFRGFLLPALCTAFDWMHEKANGEPPLPLDARDNPMWSVPSMITASIMTSLGFALMHAEQTGYAVGPFVLLVCVSLVLCWARLSTRSLAASVIVHASYNLLLFTLMLIGTHGFRHLDKL